MKEEFRRLLLEEHNTQAEAEYIKGRREKARKIRAVLRDFRKDSGELLDIGCSLGIISDALSEDYKVTGIDVDETAIDYARNKWRHIRFLIASGEDTGLPDESFDVVVCTGIYEHVEKPRRLMSEIRRLLRPGGVCYFTAMNRFIPIEPHYRLAFLSYLPRRLSDLYLSIFKGKKYDVKAYSLRNLKRLVSDFKIVDYTRRIIDSPGEFCAFDAINPGSLKHKIARFSAGHLYFMIPTYVWLLVKDDIKPVKRR